MDPSQREAIWRALQDDAEKLLARGVDNDPDLTRLERELNECHQVFRQLSGEAAAEGNIDSCEWFNIVWNFSLVLNRMTFMSYIINWLLLSGSSFKKLNDTTVIFLFPNLIQWIEWMFNITPAKKINRLLDVSNLIQVNILICVWISYWLFYC